MRTAVRVATSTEPNASTMRLRGRQLLVARAATLAAVGLALAIYVASMVSWYALNQVPCPSAGDMSCITGQLAPEAQAWLQSQGIPVATYALFLTTCGALITLPWLAISLLILWRRPDERMAYLAAGFLLLQGVTSNTDALARLQPRSVLVLHPLNALSLLLIIPIASTFPNGRWFPRWTLWLMPLHAAWAAIEAFDLPAPWGSAELVDFAIFAGVLLLGSAAQFYRYRRISGPIERQQAKWLMFGLLILALYAAGWIALSQLYPVVAQPGTFPYIVLANLFNACSLFAPVAIAIAILRYRLWDIDILISRTLVGGALTACVIGIYIVVVGYLGTLFGTSGNLAISLLAAGLVAVLFQPLRARLQRGVNRMLYGDRDEPYAVVARLGQRLEATLAPETVLPTIVEIVAQALKLPYAAIVLKHEEVLRLAAAHGAPQDDLVRLALTYRTETVGQLLIAPRAPGERFSPADQQLLEVLAYQAGIAAHAVRLTLDLRQLTADLQHSREQLITAREEERRRLRRDLHDGIGPTLASLSQRLDAAMYLVRDDPDASLDILGEVKGHVRTTLADIRRLVYALRPPILDELGLAAAIKEHAASYQQGWDAGQGPYIQVDVPDTLPALPAAVELTAYRIVLEALTNSVRHAHATTCTIQLALAGAGERQALALEVTDNGVGLAPGQHAGVGHTSIRERVAELGGTCTIDTPTDGGTRVCAWLPLSL